MNTPALDIEIDDLSKYFGSFCAVDKMNFNVKHGEVFGLLGPNGAGKSTLIRMLTTLVPPTGGRPAFSASTSCATRTACASRSA